MKKLLVLMLLLSGCGVSYTGDKPIVGNCYEQYQYPHDMYKVTHVFDHGVGLQKCAITKDGATDCAKLETTGPYYIFHQFKDYFDIADCIH